MKVIVTMKTPDALDAGLVDEMPLRRAVPPTRSSPAMDRAKDIITKRWMEWGEYLTVEFDTDAGTATVIELESE